MKLAIIGDIHFKKNKNDIEKNYRNRVLYFVSETLKERGINTVINLGDFFDDRKNIDISVLAETKELFWKYFSFLHKFYCIIGNHCSYFRNTLDISSVKELMPFSNFIPIGECINLENCLLVPWINDENAPDFTKAVEETKSKYCMGHFEINSFAKIKGFDETNGLSTALFHGFKQVFSGHFHLTQDKANISYVGSLFQNDRNDLNDIKRIMILDTDTGEVEEIRIPFELFKRVTINSEEEMNDDTIALFDEKIVDLVFNIPRTMKREKFIDKVSELNGFSLNVIDNSELAKESVELQSHNEEIVELFQEYLTTCSTIDDKRKDSLKNLFVEIYEEVKV
jgi:hypothetical protein